MSDFGGLGSGAIALVRPSPLILLDGAVGKSLGDVVEQIVQPQTVLGGNGKDMFDSQAVKFPASGLCCSASTLFTTTARGLPGAAQELRQLFIQRHHTLAAVHHQQQVRGFLDGHLRLAIYFDGNQFFVRRNNPPVSITSKGMPSHSARSV